MLSSCTWRRGADVFDTSVTPQRIESCLSDLHSWFCCNGLALNPDKSDAIQFSTVQRARFTVPVDSVTVAGATVSTSDTITTLGVQLDNRLSFNRHVKA